MNFCREKCFFNLSGPISMQNFTGNPFLMVSERYGNAKFVKSRKNPKKVAKLDSQVNPLSRSSPDATVGMLWLTNAAAVPTTPPGRGDRAVSVGRSLQTGWKVTLYPGRNSGAGCPGMRRGSQNHEKSHTQKIRKNIEQYVFVKSICDVPE